MSAAASAGNEAMSIALQFAGNSCLFVVESALARIFFSCLGGAIFCSHHT